MKVELKDAKVELEVGEGKPSVYINGKSIPIPREVGVALIFGEEVSKPTPPPTTKPGVVKAAPRKYGPQSPAAKRKLSESLKRYHANKRRKQAAQLKKGGTKPKFMNGSSLHVN